MSGLIKIVSWNLLRLVGATVDDVVRLVRQEQPHLLLMQEVTKRMDELPKLLGGSYARVLQPGRVHGLAYWSPYELPEARVIDLQPGAMFRRVCQVVDLGAFSAANVHLSHGQLLNRRQLRRISGFMPHRAAVLGDYNLVGPTLLPGFRDVGPREHTHRAVDMLPLRLDRCLVRGLLCGPVEALHRSGSDHRPIVVRLGTPDMRLSGPGRSHLPRDAEG
ncbi:MAG: endonuclease/exonuclease/phosphatase family protein [Janthinobacterium lividum]